MDKKPLIMVSLCAVVLLVMGSLSNVVGFQTVQTSQQNIVKERINQELLFQTICAIANNKQIQRIILKSQMSRGIFPTSDLPVITKQHIRQIYFLGLILLKVISKSRIQSMIGKYQFNNQEMQKEISAVIVKDVTINSEITQLQELECDCKKKDTTLWSFPVLCVLLYPLYIFGHILSEIPIGYHYFLYALMLQIGETLNCFWEPTSNELLMMD